MKPITKQKPNSFGVDMDISKLVKSYMMAAFAFLLFFNNPVSKAQVINPYNDVSYYVVDHQDDWQLFMGTNASNDIISGEKVVIIYISAGDLNWGSEEPRGVEVCNTDPNAAKTIPYYIVREAGATYSLHLLAESGGGCFNPYPTITFPNVNGRPIKRYEYRNTVSYFLRVIDNQFHDMGWFHSHPASAIDGSTVYQDWCDLTLTIAKILVKERVNHHPGWLNIPEIEEDLNPFDHPCHRFAGQAALHAVNFHLKENYPTALFVGYDSKNRAPNLNVFDAANEAGLSAAYCAALINHRVFNEWTKEGYSFQEWCGRNYFRVGNSQDIYREYDNCRDYKPYETKNNPNHNDGSAMIYPNPSNSILTVDITQETDNNSKVIVYDIHGASVFEQKCEQHIPVQVNVANFEPGSYYVHIITKAGATIQKTIVLKE